MNHQIITFLLIINYATPKYTFTIIGTTTAEITSATTTLILSSPASTTPVCTIEDGTASTSSSRRLC